MKFGKYLKEQVSPEIAADPKFSEFRAAMIPYKNLKQRIKAIDFAASRAQCRKQISDECSICFEPFGFRSDEISTRCGHHFHACCLVDAFGAEGSKGTCPLCRCPVSELVPSGFDGDLLRFLAMVRINLDSADKCYEQFLRHLQKRTDEIIKAEKAVKHSTIRRFFAGLTCDSRQRQQMQGEAMRLREQAAAAERFAAANRDGFRKILKKFDRRSGARPLSPHILTQLAARGFARDADAGAERSRLAAVRRELTAAFHLPPEQPTGSCLPQVHTPSLLAGIGCSAARLV